MAKLDLYEGREPHIIYLKIEGKKQEFKVPTDFTEEEIERILEVEERISKEPEKSKRMSLLYDQIAIMLRRYNPDITLEWCKKNLERGQAVEIINFVSENNFKVATKTPEGESKKKLKN